MCKGMGSEEPVLEMYLVIVLFFSSVDGPGDASKSQDL